MFFTSTPSHDQVVPEKGWGMEGKHFLSPKQVL